MSRKDYRQSYRSKRSDSLHQLSTTLKLIQMISRHFQIPFIVICFALCFNIGNAQHHDLPEEHFKCGKSTLMCNRWGYDACMNTDGDEFYCLPCRTHALKVKCGTQNEQPGCNLYCTQLSNAVIEAQSLHKEIAARERAEDEARMKYKPYEDWLYVLVAITVVACIGVAIVSWKWCRERGRRRAMKECETPEGKDLVSKDEHMSTDNVETVNELGQSVKTFQDISVQVDSNDIQSCDENTKNSERDKAHTCKGDNCPGYKKLTNIPPTAQSTQESETNNHQHALAISQY